MQQVCRKGKNMEKKYLFFQKCPLNIRKILDLAIYIIVLSIGIIIMLQVLLKGYIVICNYWDMGIVSMITLFLGGISQIKLLCFFPLLDFLYTLICSETYQKVTNSNKAKYISVYLVGNIHVFFILYSLSAKTLDITYGLAGIGLLTFKYFIYSFAQDILLIITIVAEIRYLLKLNVKLVDKGWRSYLKLFFELVGISQNLIDLHEEEEVKNQDIANTDEIEDSSSVFEVGNFEPALIFFIIPFMIFGLIKNDVERDLGSIYANENYNIEFEQDTDDENAPEDESLIEENKEGNTLDSDIGNDTYSQSENEKTNDTEDSSATASEYTIYGYYMAQNGDEIYLNDSSEVSDNGTDFVAEMGVLSGTQYQWSGYIADMSANPIQVLSKSEKVVALITPAEDGIFVEFCNSSNSQKVWYNKETENEVTDQNADSFIGAMGQYISTSGGTENYVNMEIYDSGNGSINITFKSMTHDGVISAQGKITGSDTVEADWNNVHFTLEWTDAGNVLVTREGSTGYSDFNNFTEYETFINNSYYQVG